MNIVKSNNVEVRSATLNDAQLLYDWVNEKNMRASAFVSGIISWEDHNRWLIASLEDPNCWIFIFSKEDKPIGQVRFNFGDNHYHIDYSIDKDQRGKGYGSKIILFAINTLKVNLNKDKINIVAKVKKENTPSIKVFEKLNFSKTEMPENGNFQFYQFSIEV